MHTGRVLFTYVLLRLGNKSVIVLVSVCIYRSESSVTVRVWLQHMGLLGGGKGQRRRERPIQLRSS